MKRDPGRLSEVLTIQAIGSASRVEGWEVPIPHPTVQPVQGPRHASIGTVRDIDDDPSGTSAPGSSVHGPSCASSFFSAAHFCLTEQ